ncbi:TRAP dicarboxylate transporter subunit DctM [Thalassospira profundimaris WP0211]|nr:TRAP dicarboxylate transporter subunit DctM [Thalassospira profundimaris WP0211]
MATEWAGLIGFVAALALALLRVPVAVAMAVVGIIGTLLLTDWMSASYVMASLPFEAIFPYGLSVVPLFIFMGVFASHSGLSSNLFRGITAFSGHRPGGLAASSIAPVRCLARFADRRLRPVRPWAVWHCLKCVNAAMPKVLPGHRLRRAVHWAFSFRHRSCW